jgi:predicted homoserine dehydrogenase-like protein
MVQLNQQYDRENTTGEPMHVKVVGVGGAGCNILDRIMLDGIEAADMRCSRRWRTIGWATGRGVGSRGRGSADRSRASA